MNITGSRDGKVFFIDDDKVMIDGKMYYEKSPQNLPKADAYSLLADVRADLQELINMYMDCKTGQLFLDKLKDLKNKVSEHFS
jgi:hypothetical protein